jgi:hypothetical protein
MNIREAAIHCECRKIAYRQSKNGIVLSLLLHPHEVPDALATAPLGTRYIAALVELGDDEQPIKRPTKDNDAARILTQEERAEVRQLLTGERESALPAREGEFVSTLDKPDGSPSRTRKAWGDMSPAQQAGLLCGDPLFQQFLFQRCNITKPDKDEAAAAVREICGVKSRSEIGSLGAAGAKWRDLVADFRVWERALV